MALLEQNPDDVKIEWAAQIKCILVEITTLHKQDKVSIPKLRWLKVLITKAIYRYSSVYIPRIRLWSDLGTKLRLNSKIKMVSGFSTHDDFWNTYV